MKKEDKKTDLEEAFTDCKKIFKNLIFFGFIINFIMIVPSIYSLQVFDRILSSRSLSTLLALTFINIVFIIILGIIQLLRSQVTLKVSHYFDKKLSNQILMHSISNSILYNNINGGLYLRDLSVIKSFLSSIAVQLLDAPFIILYIIALYFIHPILCLISIIFGIILLILSYINNVITKEPLNKLNEMNIIFNKMTELSTRNAEVIDAMGMKTNIINNWNEVNNKLLLLQEEVSLKSNIILNITSSLKMITHTMSIGIGAYLVITNKMSPGGMIAGSILSAKALAPFEKIVSIWRQVVNTKKSYLRINQSILSTPKKIESIKLPIDKGDIIVEKVGFLSPITKNLIIKGVNIKINSGEIVVIIGHSGSGKTTLIKLISGIYLPTSGVVRLNNANIYNWNKDDIGKHLGYLSQNIELFDGTVKDNISRMDKTANSDDVIQAAQDSFTHNLILKLPNGYETNIGAEGAQLSAGQRQRIGIARAFYGNPKIIILDEPNSNLDMEGEKDLINSIELARAKKQTVLITSHKGNILDIADKILVMQNGEAKIYGNKQDVLKELQKNK